MHLYTSNAPISRPPSLQTPTNAPNVLQCTSNMKHPKAPPRIKTSQDPLPYKLIIKYVTLELACGPITYGNTIYRDQIVQTYTHTQKHMAMLEVRWSTLPLSCPLVHFSFLVHTIHIGLL